MTPLSLVVAALAVYRVAVMVTYEDGPWLVFARLRGHAEAYWPEWVADGLSCPRCVSVWAALVIVPAMAWPPSAFVVAVLAVSGLACIVEAHA